MVLMKWTIAFAVVFMVARVNAINLTGGDIIGAPTRCMLQNKPFICLLVEKNKKQYKVVADEKGEYQIYEVELTNNKTHWTIKTEKLIWTRAST